MKTIKDELIEHLVSRKQDLGEYIECIIYDDMASDLSVKNLVEINDLKRLINECYELIDILEKVGK